MMSCRPCSCCAPHSAKMAMPPRGSNHAVLSIGCGGQTEELHVAACGGDVGGADSFGSKAGQIMWSAGLGAGAGQALAAERLDAHHGSDLIAIDVEVSDPRALGYPVGNARNPAVQAERQAEAGG